MITAMASLTVALTPPYSGDAARQMIDWLAAHPAVSRLIVPDGAGNLLDRAGHGKIRVAEFDLCSGAGITQLLDKVSTEHVMVISAGELVRFAGVAGNGDGLERFLAVAQDSGAGLLYSDFRDEAGSSITDHPLIDYQEGSLRDNFDFGPVLLISKQACNDAIKTHGRVEEATRWAGLYDLRLKISIDHGVLRVPEPLYTRIVVDEARESGARHFDYLDARHRDYQREMEEVATAHLKRIGAYLDPVFRQRPPTTDSFPVRASIVIPVRNRVRTVQHAVLSALSQKAPFDFNVIVVDNHSTDGTTDTLRELTARFKNLVHLIPQSRDLGIGGCWNEAIYSHHCGALAAQLDSDDLYRDDRVLELLAAKFDEGPYGMVIGSYTIVDFELQVIPPGLIDHREWTRENGRNNALRVNGLGAPRAFHVPVLRSLGFPNTSYGEDYAVGLRLSREYEIGRIYESIYFARRWEGNSDARLDPITSNRYDDYKDRLRTVEIHARRRMNRG